MYCDRKVYLSLLIIAVLPSTMMTSNIVIVDAQSIILPEEKPTISTTGNAEKEISPDESRIFLAVENTNANPNTARKNNADTMNTIISVLKHAGLNNENVSTSAYQVKPNYDYENNQYEKIISYTVLNRIELKISANSNISKFIDLAVNNGANRVENIDFVVSKEKLDATNLQLLKDAFTNARQKAEILAEEGNFTITGIKEIDTSSEGGSSSAANFYNNYADNAAEKMPSPSTQIIPQKNKVTVSVPVIFYISNVTH